METVNDPAAEREPDHITPSALASAAYGTADYRQPLTDFERAAGVVEISSAEVEADVDAIIQHSREQASSVDDRAVLGTIDGVAVEPERRTVSLEVLTDELRDVPMDYEPETGATNYPPPDARVGVILRYADKPVQVTDVDSDWRRDKRARSTAAIFGLMLLRATHVADHGAELLMPTPDVLAALNGRTDATFWTAPVPVRAEDVQEGWISYGYSGPGVEEPVTAKNKECKDPACPWPGDCTALTIGADPKPQHFADWTLLDVRIPASVTR